MITAEPSGSYIASTEAVAYLAEGELMQKRFFNAAAAVLVAAGATACSSPSATVPPGEIPAGTAKVTINDRALPATTSVKCVPIGWLTTITTGESAAGVTALVSNETKLLAKSVSINGVGGFTGRYMKGIEGRADVSMAGRTYVIRGTADGFDADNPTVRTTGTFAIRVSC